MYITELLIAEQVHTHASRKYGWLVLKLNSATPIWSAHNKPMN